jgi:beta-glucanase (GH16 family)
MRSFFELLESRRLMSSSSVVLLDDNFNGLSVNTQTWSIPSETTDGSTFVGRTQFAVSQNASPPRVSGGKVRLTLDSYNPTGLSFYGTELISNKTFKIKPGAGLVLRVRAKLNAPIPGGVVGGLFLYMVKPDGVDHDEVDTELESNQFDAGTNQVETNVYADQPQGAGSPLLTGLPLGGNLIGYHTYEMRWYPGDGVSWYVDGKLVRTESDTVPLGPMKVYLNLWAPDTSWPEAYNADIQPVSNPAKNVRFSMDVSSVLVKSVVIAKPSAVAPSVQLTNPTSQISASNYSVNSGATSMPDSLTQRRHYFAL